MKLSARQFFRIYSLPVANRFISLQAVGLTLFGLFSCADRIVSAQENSTPKNQLTKEATNPSSPNVRKATANYPLDAVVDAAGNVWVVDLNAHCVWKRSSEGLSKDIVGSGRFREKLNAVRAIALDSNGLILVGDPATREVYRRESNGDLTPLMSKETGIPMDIAVSSDGTIYTADVERHVIWALKPGTPKPTQFAKENPRGLFVDKEDRLWVVSQNAEQIVRFNRDGSREVIVGKRIFEFPHQIVVDYQGSAYVSDGYKKAIWKIESGKEPVILFEGAPLQNPVGLFFSENQLGIVDPHTKAIYRLSPENKLVEWFTVSNP